MGADMGTPLREAPSIDPSMGSSMDVMEDMDTDIMGESELM